MSHVYLGRSALRVSRITLGTMNFGGSTDEATAHRIVAAAREAGINAIDTADVYQKGATEPIVGRAIAGDRDHWVLATKLGNAAGSGPNQRGQSRKWIVQQVEASLKRLGTDYIDLLYLHRADFDAPLGEAVRALGDLVRAGKLRYFGVSNFRAWRIAEVVRLAEQEGIDRPVASQPLYNLLDRQAEVEQLPAAGYFGLGVVSYSPLARGVLSGKYRPGETPATDSRAGRSDKRFVETEWRPESVALAQQVVAHAQARGIGAEAFALAWALRNRLVHSVIAGPRTEAQWQAYLPALQTTLGDADEAFVDGLVHPGHSSTPGYTDPGHPVEGRVLAPHRWLT
jgi:aryl-alcohol dehydrogenase-like predicted oxidoreductase